MRRVAWRPVLLAICALAALVQVALVLDVTGMGGAPPWAGSLGAVIGPGLVFSKPFHVAVTAIDPGGPAARAGLHRGDLIDIRANTLSDRFSLLGAPLNRPVILLVDRGSLQKELTVIPRPVKQDWIFWLGAFEGLWLLLFAAVIAWRRAEILQMRLLSLWLAVFVFTGVTLGFPTPWAWMYILVVAANTVAAPLSVALLAAFAGCFAQPLSLPRRIAQWLCYTFAAILIAPSAIGIAGTITLRFDPVPFFYGLAGLVLASAAVLMAAVCGVLAIAASRGVERQRAVWTLVPIAAFFIYLVAASIAVSSSSSYATSVVANLVSSLVLLVAPVALTYAALSRRLIDIGFFLNRAAVFTIVSTIVIGAFVLAEWAASQWLVSASHTVSTVIGMGVALTLGLSLRFIHRYVERFVDRVFFRKRHEDEAALRRFAHESSFITNRSILLERAVREVKEHANASDVVILVRDGAATYVSASNGVRAIVSENDPGIVALRAWGKPVDLHALEGSELRGEFAFPMISRGALVGVLVCGSKRDGEVYAPDESDALLALAHGVGTTLDTLSSRGDGAIESLRETQTLIVEKLDALTSQVTQALPPTPP